MAVLPAFGTSSQQSEAEASVEEAYAKALAAVPEGQPKQDGIAAGRAGGEATLALRKEDGATRSAPYTPASGPGRWRPQRKAPIPASLPASTSARPARMA
jgi:hypothetical protein